MSCVYGGDKDEAISNKTDVFNVFILFSAR